jgi:hypothetical protein
VTPLPGAANDVVRLTRAGLSEDIILTEIKGSAPVVLNADQLLYLSSIGVSQNVIRELMQVSAPDTAKPSESAQAAARVSPTPTAAVASMEKPAEEAAASSVGVPLIPGYPGASLGSAASEPEIQTTASAPPAVPHIGAISVAVSPATPWTDTGIDLVRGELITVSASGSINISGAQGAMPVFESPDGSVSAFAANPAQPFLAPALPQWSLVGRVSPDGGIFEVGSSATFAVPSGGRLYLGVNGNALGTNLGGWSAIVSRPSAAQSLAALGEMHSQANFDYFHQHLALYGNWIQVAGYGWCWIPSVAAHDPDWRPYADQGQWVSTDSGLFWRSDYSWGDIVFHYGRWSYGRGLGWLWIPGYDWSPAWVCWRHANAQGFVGWAPLPPTAVFVEGRGLRYRGQFGVDLDFGMPGEAFVFLSYDHLWDRGYRFYFVPRGRANELFGRSEVRNGYRFERDHFVVEGPGRERIQAATHREIQPIETRQLRVHEEAIHFEARRTDYANHVKAPAPSQNPSKGSNPTRPSDVAEKRNGQP